jgi:hypothetical protein
MKQFPFGKYTYGLSVGTMKIQIKVVEILIILNMHKALLKLRKFIGNLSLPQMKWFQLKLQDNFIIYLLEPFNFIFVLSNVKILQMPCKPKFDHIF